MHSAADQPADEGAGDPQRQLVHGLAGRAERDEKTRDDAGADAGPVEPSIDDVGRHRRQRGLQREAHVLGIGERVRHE